MDSREFCKILLRRGRGILRGGRPQNLSDGIPVNGDLTPNLPFFAFPGTRRSGCQGASFFSLSG